MEYIKRYINEDKSVTISAAKIEQIKLNFVSDLTHFNCCKKSTISDGCEILFWDNTKARMCNNCLYDLFIELSEKIRKSKLKNNVFYELHLPSRTLVLSYSSLYNIKRKLYRYFFILYKEHIRDDLFLDNTTEQRRFLQQVRAKLNEPANEFKYTKPMSKGDKKKYFNAQYILNDTTRCDLVPILITTENLKEFIPVFELKTYSVISDIPCKINLHDRYQEAVYAITDGRNNGFTFTFCPMHLYQFADVLKNFYKNYLFSNYSNGVFSIEKYGNGTACYLTGFKKGAMFKLHLNKCSVILSRTALDKMAFDVLTSTVYKELYPIEASQFAFIHRRLEISESEKLKNSLIEEQENHNKEKEKLNEERDKLIEYYNSIVNGYEEKIEILKDNERQLTEEISELKHKLNHIDDIVDDLLLEKKRKLAKKIRERTINCLTDNTVETIGVSKKTAKEHKIEDFKTTFVYGMSCSTFPHYPKPNEVVIIETGRGSNDLCFALCPTCINIILRGLKQIHNGTYYFDEAMNFEILLANSNSGMHCYKCGKDDEKVFQFKFGNKRFSLCRNCTYKFEKQLERIKQQFEAAHKFGGFKYFNQVVMLKESK